MCEHGGVQAVCTHILQQPGGRAGAESLIPNPEGGVQTRRLVTQTHHHLMPCFFLHYTGRFALIEQGCSPASLQSLWKMNPAGEYHSLLPPTWEIGLQASCAGSRPFAQPFTSIPAVVEPRCLIWDSCKSQLQALPAQVTTWHSVLCTGQPSCPKTLFSRDISRAPSPSGGLQCPQKKPRPLLHDSRPSPP